MRRCTSGSRAAPHTITFLVAVASVPIVVGQWVPSPPSTVDLWDEDEINDGCAEVVVQESNSWHDSGTGNDRFSLKVSVDPGMWLPTTRITLTWADYVEVDRPFGATVVNRAGELP